MNISRNYTEKDIPDQVAYLLKEGCDHCSRSKSCSKIEATLKNCARKYLGLDLLPDTQVTAK